ncbi:MAG: hypothetical protein JNK82_33230 [Myxococcaceae bacterium]|nr:hypothetical protein [Myxococcaceae bacterium]
MKRFNIVALVVVGLSAPAFAHITPQHFRGALLGSTGVYFQADGPGLETPVEQLTREQLQNEYQRLDREKPGIGGPIALLSVGGGLLIFSFAFFAVAVAGYLYSGASSVIAVTAYVLLAFSAALGITGAVLLTVGLVKLFTRIGQRRAYSQRMDDINARLDSLDRSGAPPPPPPDAAPLPPPPPGAGFFDVKPSLVVATF